MSRLSEVAAGVALSGTLVVAYVLCAIALSILPGPQFSHMWLALFSAAPMNSWQALMEGIAASIVVGFISGYVFAWIYNKVAAKRT